MSCKLQVQRPLADSEASGRPRRRHGASCSPSRWTTAAMRTQRALPKSQTERIMAQQTKAIALAATLKQPPLSTLAVLTTTAEGCSLAGTLRYSQLIYLFSISSMAAACAHMFLRFLPLAFSGGVQYGMMAVLLYTHGSVASRTKHLQTMDQSPSGS